jgi:exosortase E/protease (VPEID-CTERM system)
MLKAESASSRPLTVPIAIGHPGRVVRIGFLTLLMAGELTHLGVPVLSSLNPTLNGWWWPLIWDGRPIAETAIGAMLVTIFLSWPIFRDELYAAIDEADAARLNLWVGAHVLCVAVAAIWLFSGMQGGSFTAFGAALWFFVGLVILPLSAVTWSMAIVPGTFWLRWVQRSPSAFIAGAMVGILSRSSGYFAQMLWPPLRHYTFDTVELMLRALGLSVVSDPGQSLLGTPRFVVRIAPACSGLEGIALICAFVAVYLWLYRSEYRFPAALVLIPVAIVSIWILNAVRITALILIGQWYSEVAAAGFHTVAGWIFFNLTAFGLVSVSRRARWIMRADDSEADLSRDRVSKPNPALPYLVPLLTMIGTAMLTAPFGEGFDAGYPVRVVVVAFVLLWYRDRIGTALVGISWTTVAIGTFCFLLWIFLAHTDRTADAAIASNLRSLPTATMMAWLLFRVLGAVITVPLAEELAFRGYLLRKLVASDFESVPFDSFTWTSFIVSSIAFGALHQSWVAGILAGTLFALAMYRRGRLADAIAAHAIANALLTIYVISTGSWSLWT